MKRLLIILNVAVLPACGDIDNCKANDASNFMVVRFFDMETKGSKKIEFRITTEDSPYQFVPFSDSTGVALPLNPDHAVTAFFMDSDISHHELVMRYENVEVSIFDPECDPSFTFMGLDTVRQTFDSTVVVGAVTNRQLNTNVEVYF